VNDVFPAGIVLPYAGATAPNGWRFCNGDAISRTTFARLFAAISTTYGVGDNTTTFNLPNTQGVFLRGAGSRTISSVTYTGTIGSSQGDQVQGHYHSKSETPHTHTVDFFNGGLATQNFNGGTDGPTLKGSRTSSGASSNLSVTSPSTDGTNGTPRTGSQTHPANVGVNYIIKL
jgi:microcystin-dependent protein